MTYEEILTHFTVKKSYPDKALCLCPCHDDKRASLSIKRGNKGTLIFCHAGCKFEDILQAASLEKQDTFYDNKPLRSSWQSYVEAREQRKIESVYNYVSCNGNYAFTKIRLQGKKLLYGKLENERFTYGIGRQGRKTYKAIYVPNGLEALNKAISENEPIFICEGEKDANTLNSKGYTSFTYGGVNDWQSDFASLVKDANVYILADNDDAGKNVAQRICADIKDTAKFVKIIVPTPDIPKGDISDYFENHSKEDFQNLLRLNDAPLQETVEASEKLNLNQFHLFSDNGRITGVYHNAIFEYIKHNYDLFICGGIPYIYEGGYYKADVSGVKLKTIIKGLMYPQFIKSVTINNIYNLFLQDADLQVDFEQLNAYPSYWICFKNGMYDAKNKRLLPHSPKYKAINQIPYEYKPDMKFKGDRIEQFLGFICEDADSREMLLQYIGYCLTKDTSQQKFLVLTGTGGSGKSTLIRLIETLAGSNNLSNIALGDLQQRFASIGLFGKLLNSCADLEISALEDTSTLKKILGEDYLRGERKGHDAISFKSYARLLFSTNELPLVKGEKTNGFYRRLLVLPMDKVPLQKNPNLFEELSQQIEYLLQISVQALERMYSNGLITVSKTSEKAVEQLRADSDTVAGFLLENCCKDEQGKIDRTSIYKNYVKYCEDTERQALTKNNFYKSLRVKGLVEFKSNGIRYFKGINYIKNCPKVPLKTALTDFKPLQESEFDELPFT